jgi:hypothetical protein
MSPDEFQNNETELNFSRSASTSGDCARAHARAVLSVGARFLDLFGEPIRTAKASKRNLFAIKRGFKCGAAAGTAEFDYHFSVLAFKILSDKGSNGAFFVALPFCLFCNRGLPGLCICTCIFQFCRDQRRNIVRDT